MAAADRETPSAAQGQREPDFRTTHDPVASHDLRDDPPANAVGWTYRRTCARCGRAVLQTPGGPLYGSATEKWCGE